MIKAVEATKTQPERKVSIMDKIPSITIKASINGMDLLEEKAKLLIGKINEAKSLAEEMALVELGIEIKN